MVQVQAEKVLSGVRVLCVDDDPDTLELLSIVLARQGALVSTCSSEQEAIAVLARGARFDVVVSDLAMTTGLGGYDLAHAIRGMESQEPDRKATPTVMVSSNALRPCRKRKFADFQVYLPKPFDEARLIHVLDRLVEADGEAVKFGSLDIWEANQAIDAAAVATKVAEEATAAAVAATSAAVDATEAAAMGAIAADSAEKSAAAASAKAP